MSKGILGIAKQIFRDSKRARRKDFEKRRDLFFEEYKELANKYKCDWNPFIVVGPRGQSAEPQLEIIDATEYLDEEKKEETAKAEATTKDEEKVEPIKPAKPSDRPGNDIGTGKF
ncbi:hypothetical protein KAU51_04080 [Candidatus Parcubacteria bacterium]|nr:hypothetical protein [Candidatus Parcubacteria bacterium]